MIHIAIVDDDNVTCQEIERQLHTVCRELMCRISIDVFQDGEGLIQTIESFEKFDLIFLDIELAKINGIGVGNHIRNTLRDQYTQIVFISGKQGYMKQLFDIRPMNFLEKPITSAQLRHCIQTYLELFPENDVFRCRVGKAIRQQSYRSVLYFKSDDKEVVVYTQGDVFRFIGRLSDVALTAPDFFWRIHKSFLINQNYIAFHKIDTITMSNGDQVPISRRYQADIRRKLLKFYTAGGEALFHDTNIV